MKSKKYYLSHITTFSQLQKEKQLLKGRIERKEYSIQNNFEKVRDSYSGFNLFTKTVGRIVGIMPIVMSAGSFLSRLFSGKKKK